MNILQAGLIVQKEYTTGHTVAPDVTKMNEEVLGSWRNQVLLFPLVVLFLINWGAHSAGMRTRYGGTGR